MNDDKNPSPGGPGTGGDGWDAGWEAHALAQKRRIAALPLWVRIDWLEDTQRLIQNLRRGEKKPR